MFDIAETVADAAGFNSVDDMLDGDTEKQIGIVLEIANGQATE